MQKKAPLTCCVCLCGNEESPGAAQRSGGAEGPAGGHSETGGG